MSVSGGSPARITFAYKSKYTVQIIGQSIEHHPAIRFGFVVSLLVNVSDRTHCPAVVDHIHTHKKLARRLKRGQSDSSLDGR